MVKPAMNPTYPVAVLHSIDELMDIAVAMEDEAAQRYDDLASRMGVQGEADLAALFRQLAELERRHGRGLVAWTQREERRAPVPKAFRWQLPETFGDESGSEPLTPHRALSIAVRNEERAFAFYTYLAAQAADDEVVRMRAESLAREELNHVSQLRQLRRRSWRSQEAGGPPRPKAVHNLMQLRELAHGLEAAAAEIGAHAARALADAGRDDAATMLRTYAAECRKRSAALWHPPVDEARATGSAAAEAARAAGLLLPGHLTADGALRLACRDAEEVLEAYLAIADAAHEEDLLVAAQHLAEAALARLVLIRAQIAAIG